MCAESLLLSFFFRVYNGPDMILGNKVFGERAQLKVIGQRNRLTATLQRISLYHATYTVKKVES